MRTCKTVFITLALALLCAIPSQAATVGGKRGAANIKACADLKTLNASWWFNWSPTNRLGCDGFVGMAYSNLQPLGYSESADYFLEANEPNLHEQGNMMLAQLIRHIHKVERLRPNAKLISPALFMYDNLGVAYHYTYTDIVEAYRAKYGANPRWSAWAVHSYGYSADEVLAWVDRVRAEQKALGMDYLPIWVTECGSWPLGDAQAIMAGTLAGFKARPWVQQWSWFPARPVTDSGVNWTAVSLLDRKGKLKPLGYAYLGD